MSWFNHLRRLLETLGRSGRQPAQAVTGLVAAVVVFDRENLSVPCIDLADEEAILDRLRVVLDRDGSGTFDGADWSAGKIRWFFFGEDTDRLQTALTEALRSEPLCKGATLRFTRNGIAGPWRETHI